jgi:TPR repeat protein
VWFTLAALKGDAASAKEANRVAAEIGTLGLETGQYHMAQMLLRGDEAPQDVMRAVSLFETLAKSHCNACKLELADAYEKGIGVPIDGEKAVYWLHQAAHSSRNADIKLRLANLYLDGALVPKNLDAAKNECAGIAQTREGMMCMARVAEHRDPPDLRKAADWYKKGAEHGSFPAMIQYGRVLAEGAGVKQDYAKAYYWLSIADYASKFRETKPLLAEVTAKLSAAEIDKQKRAVDKAIAEKQIRSYEEKTGQAKGE